MATWIRRLALALMAAALPVVGCATSVETDGAGGSSSEGGEGGAGGAGGAASPCPVDCSTIQAPPCFMGTCNEATLACDVVPSPKSTPCEDGLFCTVDETCEEGVCGEGVENTCGMAPGACNIITCNEASKTCSIEPGDDGLECQLEGDLCTVNAACKNGQCVGTQKDCFFAPGIPECHVGVCNPATGECEPMVGDNGVECPGSGDLCMVEKTCLNGMCQGGFPMDCSWLSDGCNIGVCSAAAGGCTIEPIPPGGSCSEAADECNTGICDANGFCQPVPTPGVACASAADECNTGVCDANGACSPVPKPSGLACASQTNECSDGVCDANGACSPVPKPGLACMGATDACNNGICDAAGKCAPMPTNEGGACNDGSSCTMGETCSAGACTGGSVVGNYVAYFTESFASNAAGWTFPPGVGIQNEWAIGPAVASTSGFQVGYEDPGTDHTPSQDNGVAGVVLGGYAAEVIHPQHYIESPPINANYPGPVFLEFWRHLNSDYTPFMNNTIGVWNGVTWVKIWESGSFPGIEDADWTHVSYDITAHKNAALKIRFGFDIQSSGVYTVSSWNIDDVAVGNAVCQ
jgi:hypothetical protein